MRNTQQTAVFGVCTQLTVDNFHHYIPSKEILKTLQEKAVNNHVYKVSSLIVPIEPITDPFSMIQNPEILFEYSKDIVQCIGMFVIESEKPILEESYKEILLDGKGDAFLPLCLCSMDDLQKSLNMSIKNIQENPSIPGAFKQQAVNVLTTYSAAQNSEFEFESPKTRLH